MSKPTLVRQATNREGEDLPEEDVALLRKVDWKSADITLYQFNDSPPCWKVRSLLHYYGVPYKSVTAYPGSKVEGLDNSYHKIPKLVVNGVQINDSAVVYRCLSPLLTGTPLTAAQIELEKRNNITGLLGALEKETVSSYSGISCAAKAMMAGLSWYNPLKLTLPYVAGLIFPLPMLVFSRMPHGRDGPSPTHAKAYREALGAEPFFHGASIGPLDLSLYGTLACFVKRFNSPPAVAVLDQCGLREWYERCDAQVCAVRPLDA